MVVWNMTELQLHKILSAGQFKLCKTMAVDLLSI